MPPRPNFPTRVTIELTNACNLTCPMCPSQSFPQMPIGFMSPLHWRRLVDDLSAHATPDTRLIPFWRGESLLHPLWLSLVRYAAPKLRLLLATNGTLINPRTFPPDILPAFEAISVSVHSPQALEALAYLRELRGPKNFPKLQASYVEGELTGAEAANLNNLPGIDLRVYQRHTLNGVCGSVAVPPKGPRRMCRRLLTDLVITYDGRVSRCCYVWKPLVPELSAFKKSLEELWCSPQLVGIYLDYPDPVCAKCDQWAGDGRTL